MTQVGVSGDDFIAGDFEVFDKWTQALASIADAICDARELCRSKEGGVVTFYMPVLLVQDGSLWVADYGLDGKLLEPPRRVESAEFFVGREYWNSLVAEDSISHLHIETTSGLRALISSLESEEALFKAFDSDQLTDLIGSALDGR